MNLHLIARDGIFSAADATRHGLDKNALRRLVRDRRCVRLATGWFAVVDDGQVPAGQDLHRLTARALGRQYRARAALSHHSLLIHRDLPTYRAQLGTVHLTSVVDAARLAADGSVRLASVSVRRPGVIIHRPVGRLRIPAPGRAPRGHGSGSHPWTMPVAHALVQAGMLAGAESFLVPADAALARGMTTADELATAVSDLRGHTGIGPVRAALSLVDGRRESPGESRTAYLLAGLGYELEPQVEIVADGRRYRADFRITGTRVLVEFDGAGKYESGGGRVLFEEKQREDALRRDGWIVVRLVWSDLTDPAGVRQRVQAALALAA